MHGDVGHAFEVVIGGIGVAAASALVAKAPHDYRGSQDLVSLIMVHGAAEVAGFPLRIVREPVVRGRKLAHKHPVGLDVHLVHYVDSHLCRELKQQRIRGIVRCPYGIDIELLADPEIPLDLFGCHAVAVPGVGIVVIDALELDLVAVEGVEIALHFYGLETDSLMDAAVGAFDVEVIEHGFFCAPALHLEILESDLGLPFHGCCLQRLLQRIAVMVCALDGEGHLHTVRDEGRNIRRIGLTHASGLEIDVPDVVCVGDSQKHIAEDAVVAEHVLTLQVCAVAPAAHHADQFVASLLHEIGNVELGCVVGLFGEASELSVHMHLYAAADAEERENVAFVVVRSPRKLRCPGCPRVPRYLEERPVQPHMVHLVCRSLFEAVKHAEIVLHRLKRGYDRRLVCKRIAHVQVHGMRIAAVLPDGRHIDFAEIDGIGIEFKRKVLGVVVVSEVPITVEALHQRRAVSLFQKPDSFKRRTGWIRNEIAAARKPVHVYCVEIAVVSVLQSVFHR